MVIDWHYKTLREISAPNARSFAMGPFGSNIKKENYRSAGVPVIRGLNLNAERFYDEGFVFLTEEKADELRNSSAFPQDIVFVAQGTIGQVGIIPKHSKYPKYVLSQNLMKVTCDTDEVDPQYIFYYFRSHYGQHDIFAYANPTGVPCISQPLTSLKSFRVPVAPLPEQRAIAAILGALDDKIELTRQMNQTLEAMAQAIFKSWFVDFEPFRDQGMEESALGPIPRGWRIGGLNNIATFVKGVSYRSDDLQESTIALVTLKSVARGGGYQQEGLKPYIGEYKPEQQLQLGEVIVAHTDLTQAAEVLGHVARVQAYPQFPTLVASLDLVIVRPVGQDASNEFLYTLLSQSEFQEHAYSYANGTTVLHLSAKALPEYQCVLPPPTLIEAFTRLVRPIYERIDYNEAQSRTLATIRDTLMPKLLSGEIRVRDAEKFVGRWHDDNL